MTEAVHQDSNATSTISDLQSRQDSHTPDALVGRFIERKRRRRLDLRTLHGTLREHGRIYRELTEKRISLIEAETRSRVLRRHSEILGTVEQAEQISAIRDQLGAIEQQASPRLDHEAAA